MLKSLKTLIVVTSLVCAMAMFAHAQTGGGQGGAAGTTVQPGTTSTNTGYDDTDWGWLGLLGLVGLAGLLRKRDDARTASVNTPGTVGSR